MIFLTGKVHGVPSTHTHTTHTCIPQAHTQKTTYTYILHHTYKHTTGMHIPYTTYHTLTNYTLTLKPRAVTFQNTKHQDGILKFSRLRGQVKSRMQTASHGAEKPCDYSPSCGLLEIPALMNERGCDLWIFQWRGNWRTISTLQWTHFETLLRVKLLPGAPASPAVSSACHWSLAFTCKHSHWLHHWLSLSWDILSWGRFEGSP